MDASLPAGEGASPPIGALGKELAKLLNRPVTITIPIAFVVGLAAPLLLVYAVTNGFATRDTVLAWLWGGAAICIGSILLGCAVAAFLPSLLLRGRDRTASVVHDWIGAREVRRILGSPGKAIGLPTTPEAAEQWVARNPDTPSLRPLRFEMLLFARRFDEARQLIDRLPRSSPLEQYRLEEARAMVDDQVTGRYDEAPLRAAIERVPVGVDRSEAIASYAVFRARRLVGAGDWRAPLVEVRQEIPGSDTAILVRDMGWPIFNFIWPRIVLPFGALIVVIAVAVTFSAFN